jgi:hypothetical protein
MPDARARLDDWEKLLELYVPGLGVEKIWLTSAACLKIVVVEYSCDSICVREIIEPESFANGVVDMEGLATQAFLSTRSTSTGKGLPCYFVGPFLTHISLECGQG